jgi:hypothetical protein
MKRRVGLVMSLHETTRTLNGDDNNDDDDDDDAEKPAVSRTTENKTNRDTVNLDADHGDACRKGVVIVLGLDIFGKQWKLLSLLNTTCNTSSCHREGTL